MGASIPGSTAPGCKVAAAERREAGGLSQKPAPRLTSAETSVRLAALRSLGIFRGTKKGGRRARVANNRADLSWPETKELDR
jgi:hypothetical protein